MNIIRQGLQKLRNLPFRNTQQTQIARSIPFSEQISTHRYLLNLYDLQPQIQLNAFVAPNCTIVGQVQIGMETQVWYGTVIRGDINEVKYVRDLNKEELAAIKYQTKLQLTCATEHKYEFLPYNTGYLQKINTEYELYLQDNEMVSANIMHEHRSKIEAQNHI